MDTQPITSERLAASVIAVPPLARDAKLRIDRQENRRLVRFLELGGVSTLLYGGNAVLYHVKLSEYAELLSMLREVAQANTLMIPSAAEKTQCLDPEGDIADPIGSGLESYLKCALGIQAFFKQDFKTADKDFSLALVDDPANDSYLAWRIVTTLAKRDEARARSKLVRLSFSALI